MRGRGSAAPPAFARGSVVEMVRRAPDPSMQKASKQAALRASLDGQVRQQAAAQAYAKQQDAAEAASRDAIAAAQPAGVFAGPM